MSFLGLLLQWTLRDEGRRGLGEKSWGAGNGVRGLGSWGGPTQQPKSIRQVGAIAACPFPLSPPAPQPPGTENHCDLCEERFFWRFTALTRCTRAPVLYSNLCADRVL